jgi:hypothetical protein
MDRLLAERGNPAWPSSPASQVSFAAFVVQNLTATDSCRDRGGCRLNRAR